MKNRIPKYAGRIKLIPVEGEADTYDMIRADDPIQEGTPLNKQLLDYALACNGVTSGTDAELILNDNDGGYELVDGARINFRLHVSPQEEATIDVNGTGAKHLLTADGAFITNTFHKDMWLSATYSKPLDAYVINGGVNRCQATITVTTYAEANITCTDGIVTVIGVNNNDGTHIIYIPYLAEWTIKAKIDNESVSKTVFVNKITNFDITIEFFSKVLSENTWARISLAAKMGLAQDLWNVGDKRPLSDSPEYTTLPYDVFILGFNHNGSKNSIDFGTFYDRDSGQYIAYPTERQMGGSSSGASWSQSDMRYSVLGSTNVQGGVPDLGATESSPVPGSLMEAFPQDLRNVMKIITLYTGEYGVSNEIVGTRDYLPLLSEYEVYGKTKYSSQNETLYQQQYDFYKQGNPIAKHLRSGGRWWLRSAMYNSPAFCAVDQNGECTTAIKTDYGYLSPIFRV